MKRTILDHTPDGLRAFLHQMRREIDDLQRLRNPPASYVEPPNDGGGTGGEGRVLCMSGTGVSIASGGAAVTYDTVLREHEFVGYSTPADGLWTHPIDAVYLLAYEHAWDTFTEGGTVQLQVDGVNVPEGLIADSDYGDGLTKTIAYVAAAGSVGRIVVTQSSGAAQTADVKVWVAITDPTVVEPVEAPSTVAAVSDDDSGNPVTLTHGAPAGTAVGDTMLLTLTGYSLEGAQGGGGSVTPDPTWTLLASHSSSRQTIRLYSKVADAADAAGTASYSWVMNTGTVGTYGTILCSTIPQANGTTLSVAVSTASATGPWSVAPPAGDWLFVATLAKEQTNSVDNNPTPSCTTTGAVQLASYLPTGIRGRHVHYAVPAGVATVDMAVTASTDPYAALIVVGVAA